MTSFADPEGMAREWLERLVPTDDNAHSLLALLDEQSDAVAELDEQSDAVAELDELGEKLGDFDEAVKGLELLARIEAATDRHDCLMETPGTDLAEQIDTFAQRYAELEAQSFALSELAMAAGLLEPNDYATDPLPLIRMFLPECRSTGRIPIMAR